MSTQNQNFNFVQVNEFQANSPGWESINEVSYSQSGNDICLTNDAGYKIKVSILSPSALRVRFRPEVNPDYSSDSSYAVTNRNLGNVSINVSEVYINGAKTLKVETGELIIMIGLAPYGLSVQDKNGRVITEDTYGTNLIFSNEAVANLKKSPDNESYFGFGEKAGNQLDKKKFNMTFFNYDNFTYNDQTADNGMVVPEGNAGGPLNPSGPLYNSMPFTLALGKGSQSVEYAYGVFLDNVSQSYFNMGSNDYSDMDGKYYFGALYGELDYYIMVGVEQSDTKNVVGDVIHQYTTLTGKSAMPPMYALGYQQGCYGYYDRWILEMVANEYRNAKIPIDGLHIDVDFQDNYRTFTSSDLKFPDAAGMFDLLHSQGFKCSTNITGIISANPYDEKGSEDTEYPTRDEILNLNKSNAVLSTYKDGAPVKPFIYNTRYESAPSPDIFLANESYGDNNGFNPYPYPTPSSPNGDNNALGTYGFYSDMGQADVQEWWGRQYNYLLKSGLDMIWQDMTCPAVVPNSDNGNQDKTLPMDLMMYDKVTDEYQPNAKIHNSFALNLVEATYEGISKIKQSDEFKTGGDQGQPLYNYNKRNFIISRGGFAGVHRYAGIWTGDSASSWDFLSINIPEVLNIGLSGLPISGCDIGGFANGSGSGANGITEPELFTRWMTAGAFLPWYRNHYDGYSKMYQEPYRYGTTVADNCRENINIRYQLLQLFYDAMFENTQTGLPICRAMFVNEVNDPQVFNHANDQFFIGNDLLVAPVVTQDWNRDVYLPSGNQWYVFDVEGGKLADPTPGGQAYPWYVPLNLVPLYVREGGIIPVRQLEQYVGELPVNPLNFYIYPGPESSYQLYQDDKTTMDAEQNEAYRVTEISTINGDNQKQVTFDRSHDQFTPAEDYFLVSLFDNEVRPTGVDVNGMSSSEVTSLSDLEAATGNAWFYDSTNQKLIAKVFDTDSKLTLNVSYPG